MKAGASVLWLSDLPRNADRPCCSYPALVDGCAGDPPLLTALRAAIYTPPPDSVPTWDRTSNISPPPEKADLPTLSRLLAEADARASQSVLSLLNQFHYILDDSNQHDPVVRALPDKKAVAQLTEWVGEQVRLDQFDPACAELYCRLLRRHDRYLPTFGALPPVLAACHRRPPSSPALLARPPRLPSSPALLALASAYPYTQQTPEEPTCDASYNKPCSIDVARFVAEAAAAALESTASASDTLDDITDGAYNGKSGYDGFYPVVYNASGRCVAHGKDASAVGLGIEAVALGGAGSPEAVQEGLLSRLIAAAACCCLARAAGDRDDRREHQVLELLSGGGKELQELGEKGERDVAVFIAPDL